MSDDALMPYVDDLCDQDPGISQALIAARLHIGDKRAKRLIDIRRRTRLTVAG